jgi:hypothetical protein
VEKCWWSTMEAIQKWWHQRFIGTGYFDEVQKVITSG